jgi:hypothetical protein
MSVSRTSANQTSTKSGVAAAPRDLPKGLSFEIADLILVRSWADWHGLRAVVQLDHGTAVDEDYEEIIALQTMEPVRCRLIMWRNAEAVFVQPLVGRRKRYGSVAGALKSLLPERRNVLTDIVAAAWPTT